MRIEVERLEDWLGREVVDDAGEKLGKLADVYLGSDGEPALLAVRSGLRGRKHRIASLATLALGREYVRLDAAALVEAASPPTDDDLAALGAAAPPARAAELETTTARDARLAAEREAREWAAQLEAEAARRAAEAERAMTDAERAKLAADEAEKARIAAEQQAADARRRVAPD
jgi:hypothetical protein